MVFSLILSEKLLEEKQYSLPSDDKIPKMKYEIKIENSIEIEPYFIGIGYTNYLDYFFLPENDFEKVRQRLGWKIKNYNLEYISQLLEKNQQKIEVIQQLLVKYQYNVPIVSPYTGIELKNNR